jgi:hypothetical protein
VINNKAVKPPKKKKDPNAPKGPGNVFFLFCRLQRDKIKDEHPEERSLGEVTKLLSAKWKGLDKEEKKVKNKRKGREELIYVIMTTTLLLLIIPSRYIRTCIKRNWKNTK